MERITAADPESLSADPISDNLAQLRKIFPEAFGEGGIDFDTLRQLLDDAVDDGEEKYGLNWHGKRRARRLALTPSAGTLRPSPDESVDWDATRNLMIEGDNLEVLKLLQKSYFGKVKLIYIDPPYNTGKDFIYPDNYKDGIKNYLKLTGQVDGNGHKLTTNPEASGRFHTDWLNMMYPRLKLARNLLRDDGVLLVSIDDGEINSIKSMLAEIFGEEQFIAVLIWDKQHSQQQGIFKRYHEYVLVVAKDADSINGIAANGGEIEAGALKRISAGNPASDFAFPAGVRFTAREGTVIEGSYGKSERVTVVSGRLVCKNGKTAEPVTLRAGWTQKNQMISFFKGQETYDTRDQRVLEFFFNSTGKLKYRKARTTVTPPTFLPKYGMVSAQTRELGNLLAPGVFSNPKPMQMMDDFLSWFCKDEDLVLDFFAGSATLGHAVMSYNADSGTKHRFIMIQYPEIISPKERAAIAFCESIGKPSNIATISKERLRRASIGIGQEETDYDGDLGFRVFKLDSTNVKEWDPRRRTSSKPFSTTRTTSRKTGARTTFSTNCCSSWGLTCARPPKVVLSRASGFTL